MRQHRWGNLSNDEIVHLNYSSQWQPIWVMLGVLAQFDDAAMEMPFPRVLRGHISATKIQQHGPQLYPKAVARVSVILCHRSLALPIEKIHTRTHAPHPAPKADG